MKNLLTAKKKIATRESDDFPSEPLRFEIGTRLDAPIVSHVRSMSFSTVLAILLVASLATGFAPAPAYASPTYAYVGESGGTTASGGNASATLDLGTHASSYLVVVMVYYTGTLNSVTVGGTTLTQADASYSNVHGTGYNVAVMSGLFPSTVSGPTAISISDTASFQNRGFQVYTIDNPSPTTAITSITGFSNFPGTDVSVTAGEILLLLDVPNNTAQDFSVSTVAPDGQHGGTGLPGFAVDWVITATNPSFNILATPNAASGIVAVIYTVSAGGGGSTRIIRLIGHLRLKGGVRLY